MRNIITVGVGDYYSKILQPTLERLDAESLIKHIATVDVVDKPNTSEFRHLVRRGEPLSQILQEFIELDPLIILAHSHHMHVPDAIDLTSNGFKVALEKPYALHHESLQTLLRHSTNENIYFLEYYLMMKTVTLLMGFGAVKKESFYSSLIKPKDGLSKFAQSIDGLFGLLPDILGEIRLVSVDILEGEGETGRLDHRGVATTDIRAGGGMIQDMLIHAFAPLVALDKELGSIKDYKTRVAVCYEYEEMAKVKFGLDAKNIGESYVEVSLETEKDIPIFIRVGKYVFGDRNVRGILIEGTKSRVFLDMNDCVLHINDLPVAEMVKDRYKYYAVIRSALDFFAGQSPYFFDQNRVSSDAQAHILKIQDEIYRTQFPVYYHVGENPKNIFKNE